MDRRSFLRTVAVSAGLIAAGKTAASIVPPPPVLPPVATAEWENLPDGILYLFKETKDYIRSDGGIFRRTTGMLRLAKSPWKRNYLDVLRQQKFLEVSKGFRREYSNYTVSLDGLLLSFDVGDTEQTVKGDK